MQLNILVIDPLVKITEVLYQNFDKNFGASVQTIHSLEEALSFLDKGTVFDLYVLRNYNGLDQSTGRMIEFAKPILAKLDTLENKIPVIVLGDVELATKPNVHICYEMKIQELNKIFYRVLNLKREDFFHMRLPKYVPFPISNFYLMDNSPCEVYIKLSKSTGEEFIKRLYVGDSFNKSDLKKYESLGLTSFYITREEREFFINNLLDQTIKNLKADDHEDDEIYFDKNADSFTIGTDMIKLLGVTPACVELVEETVNNIKTHILKSGKLSDLFKNVFNDKHSFSYRRSYLICIISHMLLPRMEWGGIDQRSSLFEKISLVSYFHDIYLETEEMLKINSIEDLRKANLSPRERDIVLNHANNAAMIIHNYPHLPQGVDAMIRQHHGSANGFGFPEAYSSSISPMAIFFIVVEEFATLILTTKFLDTSLIVKDLKAKFTLPSYRKYVTEIEAVFAPK